MRAAGRPVSAGPRPGVGNAAHGLRPTRPMRRDIAIVLGLVPLAALAHGVNMGDYPAPTIADDEGTYVQQAWAVAREGHLAPYTYTYDHVPGGWIQIGLWLAAVGPRAFGSVTDTSRVLILILHVSGVALLYLAARRLGMPRVASAVAGVLYAASPLVLFYGREAILDNVMAFWLVAALALLVTVRRPYGAVLGGAALGIAVLSKEPAAVLVPAYAFLAWTRAPVGDRSRDSAMLAVPAVAIAAVYPAYALLQGQLWPTAPAAIALTDPRAYAGSSLLDSVLWQLRRPGGNPLDASSEIRIAVGDWLRRDVVLVIGGVAASIWSASRGRGTGRAIGVLGVVSFGFLVHGGIVFPFHFPLAAPFLALNLGAASTLALGRLPLPRAGTAERAALAVTAVAGFWIAEGALVPLYAEHPGTVAREAVTWIDASVPRGALIVGRDPLWPELHEPSARDTSFPSFVSYWRLAYDRQLRAELLGGQGWRAIGYVLVSPEMLGGLRGTTHDGQLERALRNARLVARWVGRTSDPALHPEQIIEIWEVDPGAREARLRTTCEDVTSVRCPGGATAARASGRISAAWLRPAD